MGIFQNSVLRNQKQDESLVALRWAQFQNYISKIDFIKTVKEEKFQDGFLKDIFEACLGYTLDSTNPSNFNLEREKKNETDSKKADGVIVVNGEIIGIVELKDQKTKNLDAVESQAFNYHASHSNSKYIIISNFDELRFYIDKKTAYEKFNLFNLSYEDFKTLHLLISFESIRDNIPLKLKEKSTNFEQTISKELYRDFSAFRTHLFENIIKNNYVSVSVIASETKQSIDCHDDTSSRSDKLDKQTLLRLTQKLCDRIIFILFAEDRGLLRSNTIKEIREEFHAQKFTSYTLYDIYKFYFQAINEGNDKLSIPRYNGGLFAADTLLDSLIIDDAYLDMEAQKLSDFDFVSDISVNILGHIFEQSLTDLEEMNASINDTEFDRKKSKRKKDGVFYTPEYITRYIVENTLGKLCSDKKEELGLTVIEPPVIASNAKQSRLSTKEKETLAKLYEYRDWLLNLKILDPACGSGAFLNQALEFLIREHKNVDDYRRAYENEMLSLYDIETNILEHNLYGVDINEDAVEIAKLSLWLRTAQKGRMLTNLSDKIVCANSLLDMPFCRHSVLDTESTNQTRHSVLDTESINQFIGCFDVVIGNPPYVRQEMIQKQKPALEEKFQVYNGSADLYVYFVELGLNLLKDGGKFSYIFPNKWLKAGYAKPLRKYLKSKNIESIIDFGDLQIFDGATTYPLILNISQTKQNDSFISCTLRESNEDLDSVLALKGEKISFDLLDDDGWNISGVNLLQKLQKNSITLHEYANKEIYSGVKTGCNEAFTIDKSTKDELIKKDAKSNEIIKPLLRGRDVGKYQINFAEQYLIYAHSNVNIENYPAVLEHLDQYKIQLQKRAGKQEWWQLQSGGERNFDTPKIVYMEMQVKSSFAFDTNNHAINNKVFAYPQKDHFLLALLNSKIGWYLISNSCTQIQNGYQLSYNYLKQMPIPKISETKQQPFIELVDEILISKEKIKKYKKHFDTLNAVDKIEITEEIEKLESLVQNNENTIDQMVYKLYGLTDDEIGIVESRY